MAVTLYKGHNKANLALNGITIGVEANEPQDMGLGSDFTINHMVTVSIRVHTAYANAPHIQQTTIEIIDAIITKLKRNLSQPGGYRIMDFSTPDYRADFEESATRGGQVNVVLHTLRTYTQE